MEDDAAAERDKLIVRLLADTGIQLGELLGLRGSDLVDQGRERYIKVRGKGSRDRLVPLQPPLFARLRKYATGGRGAFAKGGSSSRIAEAQRPATTGRWPRALSRT